MPHIHHRVGIKASPESVYAALTTLEGLAGWWTPQTAGDPGKGGTIEFRFGEWGGPDMHVTEATLARRVEWRVVRGKGQWEGTTISFELEPAGEHTGVRFRHAGFATEEADFAHVSAKWVVFLLSLKAFVERGQGTPFPSEAKIDEHN